MRILQSCCCINTTVTLAMPWQGQLLAPRRLSAGVPRGSVLGPLLCAIYTTLPIPQTVSARMPDHHLQRLSSWFPRPINPFPTISTNCPLLLLRHRLGPGLQPIEAGYRRPTADRAPLAIFGCPHQVQVTYSDLQRTSWIRSLLLEQSCPCLIHERRLANPSGQARPSRPFTYLVPQCWNDFSRSVRARETLSSFSSPVRIPLHSICTALHCTKLKNN